MEEKLKITLANGKDFAPENIDLKMLMNMDNIPRGYIFAGYRGNEYNLMSHSVLCAIIGAKYYEAMPGIDKKTAENFHKSYHKYYFIIKCLFHDIQEVVTSDIPKPMKNSSHKEVEQHIYLTILDWLGVETTVRSEIKYHLKVVDLLSSLWETKQIYNSGMEEILRVYHYRNKRLFEHTFDFKVAKQENANHRYIGILEWFETITGEEFPQFNGEVE